MRKGDSTAVYQLSHSVSSTAVSYVVCNVAVCEQVELLFASPASGIDWEKNWPSDQASDHTDDHRDLEQAEEEVAVEGVVSEHIRIWKSPEVLDPAKHATLDPRRAFILS